MKLVLLLSKSRCLRLTVLIAVASILQMPLVRSGEITKKEAELTSPVKQRLHSSYDQYILGPGDGLQIELLDLPELSGTFTISPEGTIYVPRLRSVHVEGLTIEELRNTLTQQFSAYVRDPQVYLQQIAYRPIRIYVGGEVRRPGYYTLGGYKKINPQSINSEQLRKAREIQPDGNFQDTIKNIFEPSSNFGSQFILPTVFDAIRTAQGITPYSDLSKVQVTRIRALGLGGGRVKTNLNFLSLINEGDDSQNIRLLDGDVVSVSKSKVVMREQLLKANLTNLSPQFLNVFVSGRVKNPGGVVVPQGSVLNQAITMAGGPKLIRGKVEFIRFNREGDIDRRIFSYNPNAAANTSTNPLLMAGDLINIRESPLSATTTVLNEITTPAVGVYSLYNIFKSFNQ